MLWNLITQQFRLLPSLRIEDCPLGYKILSKVHGFGYDCLTDDYKVIQCTYYCDPPGEENSWYIYSLRSSSWRKLDVDIPYHSEETSGFSLYLNEICHWYGWTAPGWVNNAQLCLVSFNLRNEVVVITHIPFSQRRNRFRVEHHLDELNGSIAYIQHYLNGKSFDIFVLGELGVKESWTKLFTFSPSPCPEIFLGVVKKCGIVVFLGTYYGGTEYGDQEITWIDLSTQVIQGVSIKGVASVYQVETVPGIDI
ncbi:hypothetical protein RJT34_05048 [Clitoria ternatea]|uniref:F-box associated beta-propeller type 1 domain-containing protein n=1 Tax=Clitoria ternatea TaxID=43366 RepID=A0AAN9K076_CLITE